MLDLISENPKIDQINHLALIMDGNRRWAKARKLPVIAGHKEGVTALKKITKYCLDKGIKDLTVYAFSTENWKRNANELEFLFQLLSEVALRELNNLKQLGVRVDFLGDIAKFKNFNIQENLSKLALETATNKKLNLHIALNYGSILELSQALNQIQKKINVKDLEKLSLKDIDNHLYLPDVPYPDLLIRTGGERRLSNFLLWQAAEAKLIFTETLWPDFAESELDTIIKETSLSTMESILA